MADQDVNDPGCGCCRPESTAPHDVRRALEARLADLDRRIGALDRRRAPAGAGSGAR